MQVIKSFVKYSCVYFQISGFGEFPNIDELQLRIAPSTVHSIILSTCEAIWNKLSPAELPQLTEEEWSKKGKNFIHYGISLNALELLMANILIYKHRITVVPPFLTTKRYFP